MEMIDFHDELKKIYDQKSDNEVKFSNPKECVSNIQVHIKSCKEFITSFFSKKEVENRIKSFYKIIKEKDNLPTIELPDLYQASNLYDEYNIGMIDFLNDVITLINYNYQNDTEKTRCQDLLSKAEIRDKAFIDSILGGENNPKKEMKLVDAIKNIEILVDYFGYFDHLSRKLGELADMVENNHDCELVLSSFNLLRNSLLYYWYLLFNQVIITYINIDSALNQSSDNSGFEFKLF